MKTTSAYANKLIKGYREELSALDNLERETCTTTYGVNETPIESDYDFLAMQAKIDSLNDKIAKFRHAVNVFNTTTMLDDLGYTIDEALVRMAMLSEKKQRLSRMKAIRELYRRSGGYHNDAELTKRNFDAADAEAEYQKTADELTKLQLALDKANMSIEFEVEL